MSITILIVAITCVISFMAFNNQNLMGELAFNPYRIFHKKEYYRFISSAFIHVSGIHLLFNMIALYSFGEYIERAFSTIFDDRGLLIFVFLYFGAVIVADIWTFFKEKNNPYYNSLGASGGVAAIVFASILLSPFSTIYFFMVLPIPAVIFGPLYIAYCIYMDRQGHQYKTGFNLIDDAAHAPHLWGSVFGFVFPIILQPALFTRFISHVIAGH